MTIRTSIKFFRYWRLQAGFAAILSVSFLSGLATAFTPDFPESSLIRGRTAAGYPYLNGGINFDEQRFIEHAAQSYNLKLIFARRAGTLTTPAFVIIGANDGRHAEKIVLGAPWFYIQLPPGGYTILARFKRQVVLLRDVNVGHGRRNTYVLRGD
ncbi:MAG TPA: hypothetical protein VIE90_13625 [Candidatus Binatia bacterium]|jgi:hypothetical protein